MSSISSTASSTALVIYDPTLPHVSCRSRQETLVDQVYKSSLESAKTETRLLSPLGQKWKERIVREVARGVQYLYVDKVLGHKMARLILLNLHKGKYDGLTHPLSFIDAITEDLRSIYPDKHLGLDYYKNPIPEYDPDRSLQPVKDLTKQQEEYLHSQDKDRPDFSKEVEARIIPNTNIGYFKINTFPSIKFPETRAIIDRTMKKILDADSLIIDLRGNNGGDPETVAFLASYLFDKKQLINQLYQRSNNEFTSFFAEPEKLDRIFGGQKPIYVLTSEQTFSAAEELAYDLQASKRGKVIGQATAGGAHPVRNYVVDDHFSVGVPCAKAINPHTGKNWEGTGVLPDYPIEKETDGLALARSLIEA
jgi:retinol-binding protein 3